MSDTKSKLLRILYAAGPGDIFGTYNYWINNQDDPSQVSVTYSSQFYDVCRSLGAEGYAVSSSAPKVFHFDEHFVIEHRPKPLPEASGILFHLAYIWYGLGLVVSAVRWRANVVVVANGTTHWFMLSLLLLLRIKVIPSLHCVLWRKHKPRKKLEQLISTLDGYLFAQSAAILTASKDVSEQVLQCIPEVGWASNLQHGMIKEFLPFYRQAEFSDVQPPDYSQAPFRIMFAGRIERDKGVFDLLEIAKRFASEKKHNIRFDLCGTGSVLDALNLAVKNAGLEPFFKCHGYCNKTQMRDMFSRSHVLIAPTTSDFIEGFCQFVAEGILVGRPVITSNVVPALSYVRPGVIEVAPNDVRGYGDALLKLYENPAFYEEKRQGCLEVQAQFYDVSKSWEAALRSALMPIMEKGDFKETPNHQMEQVFSEKA